MYVFNMTNLFFLLKLFRMKTTKKKRKRGSQRWSHNSLTGVRVWISQNGWHRLTVIPGIRVFIFLCRSFHPFMWFNLSIYVVQFVHLCDSFHSFTLLILLLCAFISSFLAFVSSFYDFHFFLLYCCFLSFIMCISMLYSITCNRTHK